MQFKSLIFILALAFSATSHAEPPSATSALTLSNASKLMQERNRELLAAKRAVEGSQADAVSAGQRPNPILSLGLSSFNLNRNQGNVNPNGSNGVLDQTLNSSIQINQVFERGGKRDLRLASAESAIKASQFYVEDALRQGDLALKNAYFDLLLAQASEKIQQDNVALYEKTLQAAALRLQAGDVAASDVARIHVDALRTQNDLRQAMTNHQKAQANLAYLIGREKYAGSLIASDDWPDISALPISNNNNLDQRADVLAAEARAQQAEQNRRLAESLKTRDVNIGLQYQHFPGQEPGMGANTLGAFVSVPLFINYQYQGEIARAEVDLTSALAAKEQARALALGDVARARADMEGATEKLRRFNEQMLTQAQKAADAAEFAYQHGALGVTDLLDSRRVLRAIQLEAASVRADFAKSLAAWQAATKSEEAP